MSNQYLYLALIVFAINLMPAFGPPTWAILVLFKLNSDLSFLPLLLIGVSAASLGRFLLGTLTGKLRNFMSERLKKNLLAAQKYLAGRKSINLFNLAFFAVSPLPSAQLFEAAGLLGMKLLPLTLSFLAGRTISYSIYLTGASTLKENGLGQLITSNLKSPVGIFVQVLSLVGIYLLTRIDWVSKVRHHDGGVY